MKEKGQSLVEFGISFLFLMFLLSGIAEFGIAYFQYVQLLDAAQEGALYGSMFPDDVAEIKNRVRASSNSPIDLNDPNVDIIVLVNDGQKDHTQACERDALSVTVRYPHKIFMPFMPQLLGTDIIMINGEVVDTILRPVCS
jgi:hypothetical protein